MKKNMLLSTFLVLFVSAQATVQFPISKRPKVYHQDYPAEMFLPNQPGAPTYEALIAELLYRQIIAARDARARQLILAAQQQAAQPAHQNHVRGRRARTHKAQSSD